MSGVARIGVSLAGDLLEAFDAWVAREGYATRSEAVKELVRQALIRKEWAGRGEVAGAVTLVYDHHRRGLANRLVGVQHDFQKIVVSVQHVHLDHHNCLEVIVVKGAAGKIQGLLGKLKAVKGIKHSALVTMTTGKEIP